MSERARALEQAREWQAIAYGDRPETWAALDYYRELGWPVDSNKFPERERVEGRIFAFMSGYREALKAAVDHPPPSGASSVDAPIYRQVYIVTHYPEGGLRGVHASQAGAEAEIAELCREYPDYTRQDFSIVCDRIRPNPPSGASPQATGGYIHHSLTDWIPTPECDCDRCTSARKSAPKPTEGASPQAETSEDEDDAPAVDSWSAPLRKPVVPKILSTDDFYALLRIIEVLPVADPFLADLQSKLSAEERRQHGNRASHLSGPEFVREIERIEALIQSRLPAPVSPVEPESSSFEANTASNLLQKVELSTLDRYRNTNQMDVDTWMVRAVASSEPRSEDDLVLLDHVIALLKPTVEPEPPKWRYVGDGVFTAAKVEPEPCVWRITSGPLGTWVNPTCVEGAIPAPWGTERAKACHLCGAPLKVER